MVDIENQIDESKEDDNQWGENFTWLIPEDAGDEVPGTPLINDIFIPPDMVKSSIQSSSGSSFPTMFDPSVFMTGSIVVSVVLPESTGDGENWTQTEINQVTAEIREGLNRWADWSDNSDANTNLDGADANVSFVFDFHYSVPVNVEPIQQSSDNQLSWICPVIGQFRISKHWWKLLV